MSKKIVKNLYSKTASVLNESLVKDAAELLGVEEDEVADAIDSLSFADYLQLGNAVDIGDADEVRSMLKLGSEEQVTEAPLGGDFNPKHIAQANKLALAQKRKEAQLAKKLAKQEWNLKYGAAAQRRQSKAERLALDELLLDKVESAIGNSFPDGDPMDWFSGFMRKHDLDLSDVDRVMKKRYGRTYDQYLIDMWDSYAADSAHDANLYISQGQDPGDSPFWSWDGKSPKVELEPNPWGSYPGSRWHKKGVNEADNPSVTPPSQGMASTSNLSKTGDESKLVKRKEVDDLMFGDEVEVADVDGQPAAAKVIMPKGPGNTVVVKGKGGNEVILKKDSIIGTPKINESWGDGQYEDQLRKHAEKIVAKKADVIKYAEYLYDKRHWGDKTNLVPAEIARDLLDMLRYVPGGKAYKNYKIPDDYGLEESKITEGYNLAGWDITDKSRLGGGSDPTWITKWVIRGGDKYRPGGHPVYLEVEEIFGDWYLTDKHAGGRSGALTSKQISQYLVDYGVPPIERISDFLDSHRTYADAENGPSPRDIDETTTPENPLSWSGLGYSRHRHLARLRQETNDVDADEEKFQAQRQYEYHKREYDRLVKSQGWHGGVSGTEVYNRDWKKEAAQHKREAAKYKKLAGITEGKSVDNQGKTCTKCKKGKYEETSVQDDWDGVLHCNKCNHEVKRHITETASGGATGAGAIATAPMPAKPAPKSRKKKNVSRKKK